MRLTADLSDLNGWLEKFVTNSGSELAGMNTRLDGILKAGEGEDAPSGAIADMHRKLDDAAAARAAEGGGGGGGVQAERLDALVGLMSEERERAVQQSGGESMPEAERSASDHQLWTTLSSSSRSRGRTTRSSYAPLRPTSPPKSAARESASSRLCARPRL